MVKNISLLMIFCAFTAHFAIFAQSDSISVWQEQVVNHINAEDFSESSYKRLMEMLGDLELNKSDTVFPVRVRQNIIVRSDRCLNNRDNPWNHTIRYKIEVGKDWSGGITLNKDAGERFRHRFPMFDSYSAFVKYKSSILGHFRVHYGAGLLINQQFSLGKTILSSSNAQWFNGSKTPFSPHSSTDEYNYMQGFATNIQLGRFRIQPFVSFKQIDAAVSADTITSIPTDGMHRTDSEINKRHTATVFNTGIHCAFRDNWYEVGASLLYTEFSLPFHRPSRAYNTYYFRGKRLLQWSTDYHAHRYGFDFLGETAFDQDLNITTINRLSHSLGEDWNANIIYRFFGRKYQQLYASTLSEGSSMQGEQGVTVTISGEPLPHWQATLMFDYFKLRNVQYKYNRPLEGCDLLISAKYSHKKLETNLSYKLKYKYDLRHNFDATTAYSFPVGLKLKSQLRTKIFSPKKTGGYSLGYAFAQALIWSKEDSPINAEIQAAYFNAEEYDTRLYISEKNILYGFNLPMLYGKGLRGSATCRYKITPKLAFELKYSLIHYYDRDKFNSGIEKIYGKNKFNLWLQMRLRL